jgi:hypothetical protein
MISSEKLQTFRTRSCAKSKKIASVVGPTLSKNALNVAPASIAAVEEAPGDHLGLDFRRALEDREDTGIAQDA